MFTTELPDRMDLRGISVEIMSKGKGQPLLFLHPGHGVEPTDPFLDALSERFQVIAPSHPGFGGTALPPGVTTVDDLAYFYLDFIESRGLKDVILVGASFGGWIAAELATKGTDYVSRLVLLDSVGVKFGGRETLDIADVFGSTIDQIPELYFNDPELGKRIFGNLDFPNMPEKSIERLVRNRESFLLFGWSPILYNPKLRQRLHRIKIPTLVLWGDNDRVVPRSYGEAYAAAIPGAKFQVISRSGHYGYVEHPKTFSKAVIEFLTAA